MSWTVLKSKEDASVNFIKDMPDGGKLECRFVRRCPEYAIIYLSSHTGCKHACRFCHLTQTGQTMFTPATLEELKDQFSVVLAYMDEFEPPADRININFMARGEALSSPVILNEFDDLASFIETDILARNMTVRFNISSIFPKDSETVDLVEKFGKWPVVFYWSLYGLDTSFRKKWVPKASQVDAVVERLKVWQENTGQEIVFHWAFIEGHNDKVEDVQNLTSWIAQTGLKGRFNLVRYNSHSAKTGREPSEDVLKVLFDTLLPAMSVPGSRIVPRVGFDVAASCGMFVE
jgi:adenine C2-methylase RlmN of 23S rRNA A2503 and tRNA A37